MMADETVELNPVEQQEQHEAIVENIEKDSSNPPADDYEKRLKELEERLEHKDAFIRKQQSDNDKLRASMQKENYNQPVNNSVSKDIPDPSNYTDEKVYLADLVKWELKNQNLSETIQKELLKHKQTESVLERKKQFDIQAQKLKSQVQDFDSVAKSDIMMNIYSNSNNDLASIIEGMENGPQIAYYLGKNIDVAYNLATMPTSSLVTELIKLQSKAEKTYEKKLSNANEPIKPIKTTSSTAMEKNPDEMSYQEWLKWRNKK